MAQDWDLDGDNLDLDDLDFDMDFDMDPEDDKRTPVEKIQQGALDALMDKDHAMDLAEVLAKNALPDEYKTLTETVDGGFADLSRLYDDTKKQLAEPVNDLKKTLTSTIDLLPDAVSDALKDKMRAYVKPDEELASEKKVDKDAAEREMMLQALFGQQEIASKEAALTAVNDKVKLALGQETNKTTVGLSLSSNKLLRRLVGYNDSITFGYQKKSLELQYNQFYAARDTLKVLTGMAANQTEANKVISHNTSLPDILKTRMSENLKTSATKSMFASLGDSVEEYTRGYREKLFGNVKARAGELTGKAIGGLSGLGDLISGVSEAAEMAEPGEGLGMAGGMAASLATTGISWGIGTKLKKLLAKNPAVAKYAKEIDYYLENSPAEVNRLLSNWDGRVFPESMTEKFPWLSNVNARIVADELKGLAPSLDDQSLSFNKGLAGIANEASVVTNLMNRSIVEIIPGFLSRILQQVTISNNPTDTERTIYSVDREDFVKEGVAAKELGSNLFSDIAARRERSLSDLIEQTNKDGKLSSKAKEAMGRASLEFALTNKPFRLDEFLESVHFTEDIKPEIKSFFADSKANKSEIRGFFTAAFKEMTRGQKEMQKEINRISSIGGNQILKAAGIIEEEKGKEVILISAKAKNVLAKAIRKLAADRKVEMRIVTKEDILNEKIVLESGVSGEINTFLSNPENMKAINSISKKDNTKDITAKLNSAERSATEGHRLGNMVVRNAAVNTRSVGGEDLIREVPPAITEGSATKTPYTISQDLSGLPLSIHDIFTKGVPDEQAIPVRLVNGENQTVQSEEDAMYELVKIGMFEVKELLKLIASRDPVTGGTNDTLLSSLTKISSKTLGAAGKIGSAYVKGVYSMGSSIVGAAGKIGSTGMNLAGGAVKAVTTGKLSEDVYVAGLKEPVLRGNILKAGGYTDAKTGKVITSIDGITGDVIDRDGNVVLTAEDVEKGIFNKYGTNLSGLINLVKKPLNMATGLLGSYYGGLASMSMSVIKQGISGFKTIKNMPRDVYVKGEATPRLLAFIMRNGGYASKTSQKPIQRPGDIDGPVVDMEGNVLLSTEDIQKGLVDKRGNDIRLLAPLSLLKGVVAKALSIGKNAIKGTIGMGRKTIGSVGKVLRGKVRFDTGSTESDEVAIKLTESADQTSDILKEILGHMKSKWPLAALPGVGTDDDGDGDRDNSLADILSRRAEKKKTRKERRSARKDKKERKKKAAKDKRHLPAVSAGGASTGVMDYVSAAASAAGGAGLLSSIGGGLATAGSSVLAAGGAALGAVSLPVVAVVAGVAAAAYGGYQAYSYFSQRTEVEPLEKLRFLQYGLDVSDEDFVAAVRELESNVISEVSYSGGKPLLGVPPSEAVNLWAEDMGVDLSEPSEVQYWVNWFSLRFIPILLTHLGAAKAIDKSLDLTDIDDDIDPALLNTFLTAVTLKTSYRNTADPYSILTSPMLGKRIFSNIEKIKAQVATIRTEGAIVDKGDKDEKPDPILVMAKPDEGDGSEYSMKVSERKREAKKFSYQATSRTQQRKVPPRIPKATKVTDKKGVLHIIPCDGRISSPYGMRVHPITKKRTMHKGVDIAAVNGSPIYASAAGTVFRREFSTSYGNVIYLKHIDGTATRYAHMERFASGVLMGDEIEQGELIGFVGNTGHSAGNHLHWELRLTSKYDSLTVDPLTRIADKSIAKDVAKEDKAVSSGKAEEGPANAKDSIEGLDTLSSPIQSASVMNRAKKAGADLGKANKKVAPGADNLDLSVDRTKRRGSKQRPPESTSLIKMANTFAEMKELSVVSNEQRQELIDGQSEMIALLGQLVGKNDVVKAKAKAKKKGSMMTSESFDAVIDLSNF